ncbi:TlpA family protein disulfide reductase [Shewanella eurypsychrophilus]|uniref:TlpA family protein disulfide reductase n=1 Tax=Shewanella eurypsychrophilus TaxID=2593656 RepID=A0ABX6V9E4_9GAMM|nr:MULTISPECIES: TlpA disulfide reductase family protein [Shewanella]QFU24088.1 redoxin domain-containing protein [Shewanella sp. YLB-09]QPG59297.1 TlpA family protein disulfide reductase [Shewanella eurypsychrophilus]
MNRAMSSLKQGVIAVLILVVVAVTHQAIAAPIAVGELAPDFSMQQLDGTEFNLSEHRGEHSVYLIFWNTWCGPCMKKTPKLVEIQNEYGEQVKLLAINTSWSDSLPEISRFQSHFSTNYAIAFDSEAEVTHLYGVIGTPTSFLVDINGVIRQVDGITHTLSANIAQWNTPQPETEPSLLAIEACNKDSLC